MLLQTEEIKKRGVENGRWKQRKRI
jgi:hypothetical protein